MLLAPSLSDLGESLLITTLLGIPPGETDGKTPTCGTRSPDGTCSLFFSFIGRQLIQLMQHSNSGWDQLPILLVHETTTYLTTAVLNFRMGPTPYFSRP